MRAVPTWPDYGWFDPPVRVSRGMLRYEGVCPVRHHFGRHKVHCSTYRSRTRPYTRGRVEYHCVRCRIRWTQPHYPQSQFTGASGLRWTDILHPRGMHGWIAYFTWRPEAR